MAHAHAMSLPHRYGDRYAVYPSTLPYRYALGPQTLSAILPAPGLGSVPRSLGKTSGMAIPKSTVNTKPITPGTANSSNPHKPRSGHRGFLPRGLSYAKRRPKLFTDPAVCRHARERPLRRNGTSRLNRREWRKADGRFAEDHPLMHAASRPGRLRSPNRSWMQQLVYQSTACNPL
jgi:hypothetical protein